MTVSYKFVWDPSSPDCHSHTHPNLTHFFNLSLEFAFLHSLIIFFTAWCCKPNVISYELWPSFTFLISKCGSVKGRGMGAWGWGGRLMCFCSCLLYIWSYTYHLFSLVSFPFVFFNFFADYNSLIIFTCCFAFAGHCVCVDVFTTSNFNTYNTLWVILYFDSTLNLCYLLYILLVCSIYYKISYFNNIFY